MYLKRVGIKNIRSIRELTLTFEEDNYAGWHVIIGDNGAGKTSVVIAIVLGLLGDDNFKASRLGLTSVIQKGYEVGAVELDLLMDREIDLIQGENPDLNITLYIDFILNKKREAKPRPGESTNGIPDDIDNSYLYGKKGGWFSVAFGPFRRFTGGSQELIKLHQTHPRLAAHLTALGEDVDLSECLEWLINLRYKQLEKKPEGAILDDIIKFINQANLLPHHTQISSVSSDGVFFKDGNDNEVKLTELSDGYRSVLSMTFEIIRQMVRSYGADMVFENIRKDIMNFDLPGVVIIDEVDAHLHPSWQVKIGAWFREYFPKVQFIVTTHSPLICHAAHKGSVWRLAAPGSEEESGQITGVELKRLLYGNILDAYGTSLFGHNVTRSPEARDMLTRMADLNIKLMKDEISEEEEKELDQLKTIFPTSRYDRVRK